MASSPCICPVEVRSLPGTSIGNQLIAARAMAKMTSRTTTGRPPLPRASPMPAASAMPAAANAIVATR